MPFCAAQIVYSNSWVDQVGSISTTNVLPTQTGGIYRITCFILGFPGGSINFTTTSSVAGFEISSTNPAIGQDTVWISDGSTITIETSTSSETAYSVYILIEQLA
jgi:hypothetical protein